MYKFNPLVGIVVKLSKNNRQMSQKLYVDTLQNASFTLSMTENSILVHVLVSISVKETQLV